jgi:hypothetical protein
MDKFPEAFKRFERDVRTDNVRLFNQLKIMFSGWAGERWINSLAQNEALKREAGRLGIGELPTRWIPVERDFNLRSKLPTWRLETVKIKGRSQPRYRDLRTGRFIKKP